MGINRNWTEFCKRAFGGVGEQVNRIIILISLMLFLFSGCNNNYFSKQGEKDLSLEYLDLISTVSMDLMKVFNE